MKADDDSLTFKDHWYVDGYNTTTVIKALGNGSFQHICSCDYGKDNPLEHIDYNKLNAHRISNLPWIIEQIVNVQSELDACNFSSPSQMKYAIESSIEAIDEIIKLHNKKINY